MPLPRLSHLMPRRRSRKARIAICVRIMEGTRVQKITVAFNHWVRSTRSLAGWRCNRVQKEIGAGAALENCRRLINQIKYLAVCDHAPLIVTNGAAPASLVLFVPSCGC